MQNGKSPKKREKAAPATAPQVTGRVVTADIGLSGFRVRSPPVYGGSGTVAGSLFFRQLYFLYAVARNDIMRDELCAAGRKQVNKPAGRRDIGIRRLGPSVWVIMSYDYPGGAAGAALSGRARYSCT